jgi:cell shape-determining protein MreC
MNDLVDKVKIDDDLKTKGRLYDVEKELKKLLDQKNELDRKILELEKDKKELEVHLERILWK